MKKLALPLRRLIFEDAGSSHEDDGNSRAAGFLREENNNTPNLSTRAHADLLRVNTVQKVFIHPGIERHDVAIRLQVGHPWSGGGMSFGL